MSHYSISTDSAIIGTEKKTLDEIRNIMLNFQKSEIERIVGAIDSLNERLAESKRKNIKDNSYLETTLVERRYGPPQILRV